MHHTVVISDVHLCESVPGDGLWMRYRQREFFPDEDFAKLFGLMCAEASATKGTLDLVFNGDLFDFDAPPVVDGEVHFGDPPRSEEVAIDALRRILDDHGVFVEALASVLSAGHTVTFVSGNHDAQLAWPGVRTMLTQRLIEAVASQREERASDVGDVGARVRYRAWFHRTEDGVHIEHGNQYDRFCSFRYPMEPYAPDGTVVQPTMGSLSFRFLVSRMGYFNPHVDSSWGLSLPGYLAHWAKYYLVSKRSLGVTWALGAVKIAATIATAKDGASASRAERNLVACESETGTPREALERHAALFAPPSCEALHAIARELWLDRAAMAAVGVGAAAVAAVAGPPAALACVGVAAAGIVAYEVATPKLPLTHTYARVARSAREIAKIHGARAVIFGHTHEAHGGWEDGVFYGNSGTWSAAFRDVECTVPVEEGKPVIWLRSEAGRALQGGLYEWRNGMLIEAGERKSRAAVEPSQRAEAPASLPEIVEGQLKAG